MLKALTIASTALLGLFMPAQVLAQAHLKTGTLHAEPRLIAEQMAAKPGQTVWIAIDFAIEEGWHTYWPGTNDTGFSLRAEVEVSPQAEAGELVWPAPHRHATEDGILDHIFEEHMTVLLPVTISEDARLGETATVRLSMRWLVCKSACIMESADRTIHIPITDAISRPSRETVEVFARARSRVPEPLTDEDHITITQEGPFLTITRNAAERLAFYPSEDSQSPRNLLHEGEAEGQSLTIEFRESEEPILGVLEVWTSPDESSLHAIEWPH